MNLIEECLAQWNAPIAYLLYWLPLAFCLVGYTVRTLDLIHDDYTKRDQAERQHATYGYYYPEMTIGRLIGFMLLTVCPIANLFAAIFNVAPSAFVCLFNLCGKILDQPLVPKRK